MRSGKVLGGKHFWDQGPWREMPGEKSPLGKYSQDERPMREMVPGRKFEEGTAKGKVLVREQLSCGAFVDLDTARETMAAHV